MITAYRHSSQIKEQLKAAAKYDDDLTCTDPASIE